MSLGKLASVLVRAMSEAPRRMSGPHNCSNTLGGWMDGLMGEGEGGKDWGGVSHGKSRDGFRYVSLGLFGLQMEVSK